MSCQLLKTPMTSTNAPAEFSQMALYQYPFGGQEARGVMKTAVSRSTAPRKGRIQVSSPSDFISPELSGEAKYRRYFSLISGISMILIILLACFVLAFYSAPGNLAEHPTNLLNFTKNPTTVQPVPIQNIPYTNRANPMVNSAPVLPVPTNSPPAILLLLKRTECIVSPKPTYEIAPLSTECYTIRKNIQQFLRTICPIRGTRITFPST